MPQTPDRRRFLQTSAAVGLAFVGGHTAYPGSPADEARTGSTEAGDVSPSSGKESPDSMKLGLVTYNIAHGWDLPTLIATCTEIGIAGVELRTTHAHGVEPTLNTEQRAEVRQRFADSAVTLWGLGSTCEFHSADPEEVKRQVGLCGDFVVLAKDVGAVGVKVRPNGLATEQGVPEEKTLEQIGLALRECGAFAAEHGVEIWLEVHGKDTCHPPRIKTIMEHCGHPQVGVCWNSNDTDMLDGSVRPYFELLAPWIKSCHITELARPVYPWKELFGLLKGAGYDRFTLAEIADSADPERLLRYYKVLWDEFTR